MVRNRYTKIDRAASSDFHFILDGLFQALSEICFFSKVEQIKWYFVVQTANFGFSGKIFELKRNQYHTFSPLILLIGVGSDDQWSEACIKIFIFKWISRVHCDRIVTKIQLIKLLLVQSTNSSLQMNLLSTDISLNTSMSSLPIRFYNWKKKYFKINFICF